MAFYNLDEILNELDLEENMNIAEFGCGSGHFSIEAAKKINKGRIYGLDIQDEKISALKAKAKLNNLKNIFPLSCDLESINGSGIKRNFLDAVLIPNLMFQLDSKNRVISESRRILKKGGQLMIIDWLKEINFGAKKLAKSGEIKKIAQENGFSLKKEFSAGDYHYGLLFEKL